MRHRRYIELSNKLQLCLLLLSLSLHHGIDKTPYQGRVDMLFLVLLDNSRGIGRHGKADVQKGKEINRVKKIVAEDHTRRKLAKKSLEDVEGFLGWIPRSLPQINE